MHYESSNCFHSEINKRNYEGVSLFVFFPSGYAVSVMLLHLTLRVCLLLHLIYILISGIARLQHDFLADNFTMCLRHLSPIFSRVSVGGKA